MTTIFDPIKLGDLELSNRIIMAPLTRCRADEGRVPNALMAEYYVQRASAGLILSEATSVTPMSIAIWLVSSAGSMPTLCNTSSVAAPGAQLCNSASRTS